MLYRSKKGANYSVNDPIGGPDEINWKDTAGPTCLKVRAYSGRQEGV